MRIKRLDITGFKSFMDRGVFAFGEGVTGVVGPNGCGKSNVVDAIRWVMGEQSAKNLRGRGMEDVIFNGSEAHPPLSMAEVTLTFAIDPVDLMPPQFAGLPEVSVTRRMFRGSNESEYEINKTACRMLDITELFLGTGVGKSAYSIIEQGRVGQIVSSRPEDRRAFIEEAAGVTKYKSRRKAAERKMEATEQNLLRVNDVASELATRLSSLERQAKKAEKYKKLKAEMREIELHSLSHRWLEQLAGKKTLEAQLTQLNESEREKYQALQQAEDTLSSKRLELEREASQLREQSVWVSERSGKLQLEQQKHQHEQADRSAEGEQFNRLSSQRAQDEERKQQLTQGLSDSETELHTVEAARLDEQVELQVAEEENRRVEKLTKEVGERLQREREAQLLVSTQAANQEAQLSALHEKQVDLQGRRAAVQGEREGLEQELAQVEHARAEVLERLSQTKAAAQDFATRKGEEEARLDRTREEFAENEIQVICLREELADKRSRLNSLLELERNYEGYDRGVRAVMQSAGPTADDAKAAGIFGLVADAVRAPQEYEKAIEAALGSKLQHVIVENADLAFTLAARLRDGAQGRSTFVPVPKLPSLPEGTPALDLPPPDRDEKVLAFAAEVVNATDASLSPLVKTLLEGVALVANLDDAREVAQRRPELTLVTREGEVLAPGQVLTGGVMEGAAVGALQKKREIAELQEELKSVEGRYNEIVTRHYELQKRMGQSEGVLKGLSKHQHAEEVSLAAHEKELTQTASNVAKLKERLDAIIKEESTQIEAIERLQREEEAAKGEVAHLQTDRDARQERVALLSSEQGSLAVRAGQLAERLTEAKVKAAATVERAEAVRRQIQQVHAQLSEVEERLVQVAQALEKSQLRQAELTQSLDTRSQWLAKEGDELTAAQAALAEQEKAHGLSAESVREQEIAARAMQAELEELNHGLSQVALKERELSLELEHLVGQMWERHQVSVGEAVHLYHQRKPPTPEEEAKLKDLKVQIERMGEVNLTAIEEHAQLSERHGFLFKQKADLEESIRKLKAAIVQIDRTSRERFQQTFEAVNEKFQQIFPRLFGGGRAGLLLTQELPGQEAGVEIVAQPPGKKLQSVSLLSGGEKALTAVSMIFAIFLIKPTPFCLLDEVDAPLDEGNVGRYNQMVKEMSKQSQFILITHNKRTMEIVDTLYGVTMEEPGVSKLVAVRMQEAANSDQPQVA
ncbi:MAG: chromosome segregation protein SMC [Myxococcaceae bacterium]